MILVFEVSFHGAVGDSIEAPKSVDKLDDECA